jgi:hypothetical protein
MGGPPAVIHLKGRSENSTRRGLRMEEGSAKNLQEETKGGPRSPGIGQLLAFSMSQVKERGGLNGRLFSFLMNRSGTRIGRFTGPYFGLWALFIIVMKLIFPTPSDEGAFSAFFGGVTVLSLLLLLLNRFDTSGPTREEFERARENWLRSRPRLILGRKKRNTETSGTRRTIERDPELEHLRTQSKKLEAQIDEVIISSHPELKRANQIVDRIQGIAEGGGFLKPVRLSNVGASSKADALAALYIVTAETFLDTSLNNTPQNQALLQKYLLAAGSIALWITTMFTTDGRDFAGEIDESMKDCEQFDSFVDFLKTIEPSAGDYWKRVHARIGLSF